MRSAKLFVICSILALLLIGCTGTDRTVIENNKYFQGREEQVEFVSITSIFTPDVFFKGISPKETTCSVAEAIYDISANDGISSVEMHLFPTAEGYTAVVSGKGAIKNYSLTLHDKGCKVMTETRDYSAYVEKINRVYVASGVTAIGDYFMLNAHCLKELVFEDSSQITYLGKFCFAETQISGEYKFCNLQNGAIIDRSFFSCPMLKGITVGVDAAEGKSIVLSEMAFWGCLNLQYFKVNDPLNTAVEFGPAAFSYCVNLALMEFQPEMTSVHKFAFLMDPVDAVYVKCFDSEGRTTTMCLPDISTGELWKSKTDTLSARDSWFATEDTYLDWLECRSVAAEYSGKHFEYLIDKTDVQKKAEYLEYTEYTSDMSSKGAFWGKVSGTAFRVPYYGSCWLFAYMHIWNVLHPTDPYDTVESFIMMLQETPIAVDDELIEALEDWDFIGDVLDTDNYAGYYSENGNYYYTKENSDGIYVTDLPVDKISNDKKTTEGEAGTASWGVRKVLGWTGERFTATPDRSWAEIKRCAIDSVLDGRPVIFECVGYHGEETNAANYGGIHAVAVIGYDADTDKFKIIDSTWGFPSGEVKMEYWAMFEEILEPSNESAIWVLSELDIPAQA